MKELLPKIFNEIRISWFAKQPQVNPEKVILELKKLEHLSKPDFLEVIGKKPIASDGVKLHEYNLYSIAWRIVEKSMDYPYQKGDVILFNGRTATIKNVILEKRCAELMTGTLVPLCSIKKKEPLLEPEQLTLF